MLEKLNLILNKIKVFLKLLIKKINAHKFWSFFIIYSCVLLIAIICILLNVHSLLVRFERSQPERVVEQKISEYQNAALNGNLEEILPLGEEIEDFLGSEKYPQSFVKCFTEGNLTYKQNVGSYTSSVSEYTILSDNKPIVNVSLTSENERTQMIVFSSADWSFESAKVLKFEETFSVPSSIDVFLDGEKLDGIPDMKGNLSYSINRLCDADIVLKDAFGNTEQQYGNVRKNFPGGAFSVPSNFKVDVNGAQAPKACYSESEIPEYEYVSEYVEMPKLASYNIKYLPVNEQFKVDVDIFDNLGNKLDFKIGDKLNITSPVALPEVPEELLKDAGVMEFAKNWSLFMTNDLIGHTNGLGVISKYLIYDSYLYNVARKWATGIDITFTSIHTLYNPPFENEKVYNFISYSEDCFSCDVYLVKKMHIANGKDVDDELLRRLYFVKYDATNDNKDNPEWVVADMTGAQLPVEVENGGEENE